MKKLISSDLSKSKNKKNMLKISKYQYTKYRNCTDC